MTEILIRVLLNIIEKKVKESDNQIDDAIVLPLIDIVRATYGIGDND